MLSLYYNEEDYVVAESAEDAKNICVEQMQSDPEELGEFVRIDDDKVLSYRDENDVRQSGTAREFVARLGRGHAFGHNW